MWILILSIVFDGYEAGGAGVYAQPGFTSYESCQKAGLVYEKQHGTARNGETYARWSCVQK